MTEISYYLFGLILTERLMRALKLKREMEKYAHAQSLKVI